MAVEPGDQKGERKAAVLWVLGLIAVGIVWTGWTMAWFGPLIANAPK